MAPVVLRFSLVCLAAAWACGPSELDTDDTFPNNCGVEGPVDLLPASPRIVEVMQPFGEFYLALAFTIAEGDAIVLETLVLDRCGEKARLLKTNVERVTEPRIGVVGDFLLSCDSTTGEIFLLDPRGEAKSRRLFDPVDYCHVVAVEDGLAAQAKGGQTVWFHPNPNDSQQSPLVVTEHAKVLDPGDYPCYPGVENCALASEYNHMLRPAGEDLLVWMEDDSLVEFAISTRTSRLLVPSSVYSVEVLDNPRYLFVSREGDPNDLFDRETGTSFWFPRSAICPAHQFGDWLVRGSNGPPTDPEPPEWTILRAHHWPTGADYEFIGRERVRPQARFSADSILVEISPEQGEPYQEIVWPASGRRERASLPGVDFWSHPNVPGAFSVDGGVVRHLAAVGEPPRVVFDGVELVSVTDSGRMIFLERRGDTVEPAPLRARMPDGTVVPIDDVVVGAFGEDSWQDLWPIKRDELLYVVTDGSDYTLRRTVVP